jgi:hypothetical protein
MGSQTWAVSLKISRSAGWLLGAVKPPELISFHCLDCYFLTVVFDGISMADDAKNPKFGNELRLMICESLRSTMCELTDAETTPTMRLGARHLQLVLSTDSFQKGQRPYGVLNVGLTDCFGIERASESLNSL